MAYFANKLWIWLIVALVFAAFLYTSSDLAAKARYASPAALAIDNEGKLLYIAEYTDRTVGVFDITGEKVITGYSVPQRPSGLVLSPDGKRLFVTGGSSEGRVYILDTKTGRIRRKLTVGHTPGAPVVSPDGKTLYVCNRFDNNISVIDLSRLNPRQVANIAVSREPVAAAVTPNGKFLLVANLLPAGAADKGYAATTVSIIDTASGKVAANIALPDGSTSMRGICVSPDGRYAYATHILARYQLPTTQLERGWMNTNALTIIDVNMKKRVNTVLLDDVDLGAANPWAVTCTADGKYLCVTHAGTHEVSVIDRKALHEKLDKVAAGERVSEVSLTADDVPNDLAFIAQIRRRIRLTGNGPRSIAVVGNKVYVGEYFSDSLGVVDIESQAVSNARSLALGLSQPLTTVRRGEMFFYDASHCFQHWQSCSSCHPGVRSDALNWDLLNDGLGNARNTKSLLLAHRTPPAMITGIRDRAETAVRAGIKYIEFSTRPEADAEAIDEYLKSLKAVPSPHLAGKKLTKAAKRGRLIFKQAGCISCHAGPLLTDMKQYDIGTAKADERGLEFDTPTLIEVWRTAPYLNDGRAATIKDVLITYNKADKHGVTSNLTARQINDLTEFVLSQ